MGRSLKTLEFAFLSYLKIQNFKIQFNSKLYFLSIVTATFIGEPEYLIIDRK